LRKSLKQDLAKQMKRASEHVRPDEAWADARSKLLDKGFNILNDMRNEDAEKACFQTASAVPYLYAEMQMSILHNNICRGYECVNM
jgi:hypothetical protein